MSNSYAVIFSRGKSTTIDRLGHFQTSLVDIKYRFSSIVQTQIQGEYYHIPSQNQHISNNLTPTPHIPLFHPSNEGCMFDALSKSSNMLCYFGHVCTLSKFIIIRCARLAYGQKQPLAFMFNGEHVCSSFRLLLHLS